MDFSNFNKLFAKNLKYQMSLKEKTQTDIAKHLGVSKSSVSSWCNGVKLPRMDKVDAICEYLNINRSDLMSERVIKPSEVMGNSCDRLYNEVCNNNRIRLIVEELIDAPQEDVDLVYSVLMGLKRKSK